MPDYENAAVSASNGLDLSLILNNGGAMSIQPAVFDQAVGTLALAFAPAGTPATPGAVRYGFAPEEGEPEFFSFVATFADGTWAISDPEGAPAVANVAAADWLFPAYFVEDALPLFDLGVVANPGVFELWITASPVGEEPFPQEAASFLYIGTWGWTPPPPAGGLSPAEIDSMKDLVAQFLPQLAYAVVYDNSTNDLGERIAPGTYSIVETFPCRLGRPDPSNPFAAGRPVDTNEFRLTLPYGAYGRYQAFVIFDEVDQANRVYDVIGSGETIGSGYRTSTILKVKRSDLNLQPAISG